MLENILYLTRSAVQATATEPKPGIDCPPKERTDLWVNDLWTLYVVWDSSGELWYHHYKGIDQRRLGTAQTLEEARKVAEKYLDWQTEWGHWFERD